MKMVRGQPAGDCFLSANSGEVPAGNHKLQIGRENLPEPLWPLDDIAANL